MQNVRIFCYSFIWVNVDGLSKIIFSLFTLGLVSGTQTFSHTHMMSIQNGKKVENWAKDINANRWLLGFFKANLQWELG